MELLATYSASLPSSRSRSGTHMKLLVNSNQLEGISLYKEACCDIESIRTYHLTCHNVLNLLLTAYSALHRLVTWVTNEQTRIPENSTFPGFATQANQLYPHAVCLWRKYQNLWVLYLTYQNGSLKLLLRCFVKWFNKLVLLHGFNRLLTFFRDWSLLICRAEDWSAAINACERVSVCPSC